MSAGTFQVLLPQELMPSPTNLWAWWYTNGGSYTETSGTPSTLISTDGTSIGSLLDQSGNGRHVYATGTARPTYKTNLQNSLATARFDAVANQMASTATPPATTNTVYVVINPTTWVSGHTIISKGAVNNDFFMAQENATPQVQLYNGSFGTGVNVSLSNTHIIAGSINGTAAVLRIDAGSDTSDTLTGGGVNGVWNIGGFTATAGFFISADIYEILHYNTTHAFGSGDGLLARRYLNKKYNLGLGI